MDLEIQKYLNQKKVKEKPKKKNIFVSLINKILICFILVIASLILMKSNKDFKNYLEKNVYTDNFSFAYINNLYNKYFGSVIPSYKTEDVTPVFNEKLEYNNVNKYLDGFKLDVKSNYLVPIIEAGIVVFSGEIENYGKVVIIEGIDGVDIWYGNIKNPNIKLYDYVTKGDYLGEVENNTLYLVFEKNKEYLDFNEYLKN